MNSSRPTRLPGMELIDHQFDLPLDYDRPDDRRISVFVREVRDLDPKSEDKPFLLFLQGGPGFRAPCPIKKEGWLKRALSEFRVLMYDTRGNGLSTPVDYQALSFEGDAQSQADYLKHFRADNIVRDAEAIRAPVESRRALVNDRSKLWRMVHHDLLEPAS